MEKLRIGINNLLAKVGYKITKADPPETMGRRTWDNFIMEQHRPLIKGKVLDAGSGDSGWSIEQFGSQCELTTFDQFEGKNIDVSGDLSKLSSYFPPESFDVVICMEVMEHVAQPFVVIEEIRKVLKPGGILLATAPFEHGLHGEEYGDYFRYTRQGWRKILSNFSEVKDIKWLGPELTPKQYFAYAIK
jgi:SAM-dependent methyltransferase